MNAEPLPDSEAICEVLQGFVSGRVPGFTEFVGRQGDQYPCGHPAVVEHWRDGFFRLSPADIIRRQQAAMLAMRGGDETSATAEPPRRRAGPGRPPWTAELLAERLRRAERVTDPPRTPQRVADNLVLLDGTKGTSADHLARLRRKYLAGG